MRPTWEPLQNDSKGPKPCFHEGKVWEAEKKTYLTREEIADNNYFSGLNDYHIRVAVKMRQETAALLETFTKVIEKIT